MSCLSYADFEYIKYNIYDIFSFVVMYHIDGLNNTVSDHFPKRKLEHANKWNIDTHTYIINIILDDFSFVFRDHRQIF